MLRTPPFVRAITLLFRRPAGLLAILGVATILATVAALTPLFLSSASSEALQRELQGRCPASFGGSTVNFAPLDIARESLTTAVAGSEVLGDPQLILEGTLASASNADGTGARPTVRFVGRDGFREHIDLLEGEHGEGAYIDEYAAEFMQLGPGDTLQFAVGGQEPRQIGVAAVYRNIYDSQQHDYWCSVEGITSRDFKGDLPPLIVLVDTHVFADDPALFDSLYAQYARTLGDWEIPVDTDGLTLGDAQEAVATLESIDEVVEENQSEIPAFFTQPNVLSDLSLATRRIAALTDALGTSILPLAGVVSLAAIGLMGGAGSYWVDRRRQELAYLAALGAGPGALSLKAVLEFFPAVVIGGGFGWGLANLLIGAIGPSSNVESVARVDALWVALAGSAAGLVAVWVVVAIRTRRLLDQTDGVARRLPWRIPGLLAAIGGAIWVRRLIGDSAVNVEQRQFVGSVDPLVLFFPLLVFAGVVLLVAALLIVAFPLVKRIGAVTHAAYLASRRVATAPTLVLALIAGAALPVATLVYAASLTRSATSTIDAKGRSFIGADVSTPVFGVIEPPGELGDVSTIVIKTERAELADTLVDVLAVDSETFTGGAYWHDSFAPMPLQEILDTLAVDPGAGPLSAIAANGSLAGGTLESRSGDVDVRVMATIDAFPGMTRGRPLVIVNRDHYVDALGDAEGWLRSSRYLMWTMDRSETEIEEAMGAAGVGFAYTVAATTTLDQLRFAAVVWTFDFLEIYAALGGLIAIGAVLLYVDARQRSRNLSYVLARRMGLRRREHLAAGFMEMATLTILGALSGVVAARLAAGLLYAVLDAVPETPPSPRWIGALDLSLLSLLAAAIVAAIAAVLAQRTADNADATELLRHGD
ncbi:MAG: hypothetical protein QNJ77_11925 [Acidimicrobiia bacterium]|nr:hypothetical protein [Acidimicrobiia bacterium]